jgi:hypothetical protein
LRERFTGHATGIADEVSTGAQRKDRARLAGMAPDALPLHHGCHFLHQNFRRKRGNRLGRNILISEIPDARE